jgi:predicted transcriptional regulator
MTVKELAASCELGVLCHADGERNVNGAYVGDLLSWVMGRATQDNAWITIMSNVNVIAVASLTDVSCVILAEGVTPDDEILRLAEEKGINLLSSKLPTFEIAVKISEFVK